MNIFQLSQGNICPCNICPYKVYLSCYWPNFDQTLKHKASIATPSPKNSTTLSTYFLNQEAAGLDPKLSWRFLKTNLPTFNPVTNKCILCTSEKFHILCKSELATLNSRSEIFSAYRHKKAELLVPPDPKSQRGWYQDLDL